MNADQRLARCFIYSCFIYSLGLALTVAIANTSQAQILFASDASARYQGDTLRIDSDAATDPPFNMPVVANALSDLSSDGFSFAQGTASGKLNALGATLGSLSYASGFDPNYGPPSDVVASATASANTMWTTSSPTLPSGSPIEVRFIVPINGLLVAEQFFDNGLGVNDVFSEASAELTVDGVSIYSGGARLSDPDAGGINSVLTETGEWVGDFMTTIASPPNGGTDPDAYEINTLDIVKVDSKVGTMFQVDFSMQTSAFIVGPFEAFTIADFSSTAAFELQAFDPVTGDPVDVQFAPVSGIPEPSAMLLTLACLFGIAGVRRRH